MNSGNRSLVVAAIGLVVLVIAAVAAVVGTGSVADLDPESPEGVVQRYVQAILDGDDDTALALLVDPERDCFERERDDFRMTLAGVEIDGDRAEVEVSITRGGGDPPFDGYPYATEDVFDLRRIDEDWRISEAPWQFQICEESL